MTKYTVQLKGKKLPLLVERGMIVAVIHSGKRINLPKSQWQCLSSCNFTRIKQLA